MAERDLPSSPTDKLLPWLAHARSRLRMQRSLRDASWALCGLLALLVAYRLLALLLGAPAVVAGISPLLLLAGVAMLGALGWRLSRATTLAQAAAAADRRGALDDELKSAYWFARERIATPMIESALRRAERTVARLEPSRLFPIGFPRGLAAALALAAAALALGWVPPRPAAEAPARESALVVRAAGSAAAGGRDARADAGGVAGSDRTNPSAARAADDARTLARLQEVARSIEGPEGDALRQAIAERDAGGAMQPRQGAAAVDAAAQADGAAARAPARQVSQDFARSIIERLQSLLDPDAAAEPEAGEAPAQTPTQSAARISPRGERPTDNGPSGPPGQHSLRDDALNMQLRSIARTSSSQGQAVAGRGEGWEEGGRTNASTGAMGQRVGVSRAGAGDDNPAQGNPAGDAPSDPVLGKRTERLAAQLQRAGAAPGEQADADADTQSLYGATQAQASTLGYRASAGTPRGSSEAALAQESTPLRYRSAVKNYFVTQHGKER